MKNGKIRAFILVFLCVCSFPAPMPAAEELKTEELVELSLEELLNTTVVTASRTEIPLSKVTKSISVIPRNDMQTAREYSLLKMINTVPGIFLGRTGGPGQLARISVRGAGGSSAQFQYDSMPLRDAADTQSTLQYFIADLYGGSNIDRVEVLRGTHSTLYGSQAMGGVINIIPEKWHNELILELRSEFGTRKTYRENARFAYGQDTYYIHVNPQYIHTDGADTGGDHDYYYDHLGLTAGAGVKFGENISLNFSSLFFDTDLAMSDTLPALDANRELVENQASQDQHRENQLYQAGLLFHHDLSELWDYSIKGAYSASERHYFWSDASGDQSNYDGNTTYLEMQHNVRFTNWLSVIIGADYQQSGYDGQEPVNNGGVFSDPVHYNYDWDVWDVFGNVRAVVRGEALILDAGMRYNAPAQFDAKGVWEVSAAYNYERTKTKIHSHVGNGYRTPSLYEVYGGYLFMGEVITIGNPNLEPEESLSYEIGLDQFFRNNTISVGMTYFGIDFDNLVVYDMFVNRYNNAAKAKTSGLETYVSFQPQENFSLAIAYTYAQSEYKDDVTGDWTRKEYLPENKVNVTASFDPIEGVTAACRVNWQGEQIVPLYDPNFTLIRWQEDGVTTVDAAVSYAISEHIDIWARAENVLDKEYSASGWIMPGRWIYGGIELTL